MSKNKESFESNLGNKYVADLVGNPLLLSRAILIHSIDEQFSFSDVESLYEKFITTLLYEWDEVRNMNFYSELLGDQNLRRLYLLIRRIAFVFSEHEVTKMTAEELIPHMVKIVKRFSRGEKTQSEIVKLCTDLLWQFRDRKGVISGSSIQENFLQTEFEFQHKTFQEYLTAVTIDKDNILRGKFNLGDKLGKPFWARTIEFYVQLSDQPDTFFEDYIGSLAPNSDSAYQLIGIFELFFNGQGV